MPNTSRRVAAAAVRRYAEPQSVSARLKRDAVVAALRTGASGLLLRDRVRITGPHAASIDGHLREALGRDLAISIHIGPARANRKPVLQLITPRRRDVRVRQARHRLAHPAPGARRDRRPAGAGHRRAHQADRADGAARR
nr:hypothetical protein GCM10020092_098060 [Actinoplanes digitatis]